jgi:branched-chain amino acid transport system permease protein
MLLNYFFFGVNYWWSLLLAPLGVAVVGIIIEKKDWPLRWLYRRLMLYGCRSPLDWR